MKKIISLSLLFLALAGVLCATAEKDPLKKPAKSLVKTFVGGCKTEIKEYCSKVEPGEGRLLACIYAHEDKLSGACEFALYESSIQLQRVMSAISYFAHSCKFDIEDHCTEVEPGKGRILACLKKREKYISSECHTAIDDVSAIAGF